MDTKPEEQTPEATMPESSASQGQVMDIATPKSVNVIDGNAPVEAPAETQPNGSVIEPQKNADVTSDPIMADEAPAEPSSAETAPSADEAAPAGTPEAPNTDAPAPETSHDNPMAIPPTPVRHHTPVLAIIVATIVALGLAGAVVFMYLKNKDTDGTETQTSQTAVVQKPAVSAADVDNTSTDIDKNLTTIDETKDFVPTDLSDASLGL